MLAYSLFDDIIGFDQFQLVPTDNTPGNQPFTMTGKLYIFFHLSVKY